MSRVRKIASFEDVLENGPQDLQAEALGTHAEIEERSTLMLARVLDGHNVSTSKLTEAARIHALIVEQSGKLLDAYLAIGQHLIDLKEVLGSKAFNKFIESREVFPFGRTQAFKMMTVSTQLPRFEQVLGVEVTPKLLPSLTVCYELTTFTDEELALAKDERLFDPLATQKQVLDFKEKIKQTRETGSLGKRRILERKYRQRADLQITLRRLEEEIRALEAELGVTPFPMAAE